MSAHGENDLGQRLHHLDALIREMEEGPESPARARARQIVRAALDLHAGALTRMMELVTASGAAGRPLVEAFARDPLVAGILFLHELHPLDLETRVRSAVEDLAPSLRAHGAGVASIAIADGAVRLRLERLAGRGGPPAAAIRSKVEDAILAAAPDAARVEIDVPEDAAPAAFVPVEQVRLRSRTPEGHPT